MNFALTGSLLNSPTPEVKRFKDEITETEFRAIVRAREVCSTALELEEKLHLVLANFYEFEVALLKIAQASLIWPRRNHPDAMRDRLLLDRRLVNVLTACRLYFDHSSQALCRLYGRTSASHDAFTAARRGAYDRIFGFRFMEALRNFVQHRGLVVNVIGYNEASIEQDGKEWGQKSVTACMNVDTVAEDPSFKKTVLEELRRLKAPVDLRLPMREYIDAIVEIQNELREGLEKLLTPQRRIYEEVVTRSKTRDGLDVLGPRAVKFGADGFAISQHPLVSEFLEVLDNLVQEHKAIRPFREYYASNCA